MSDLWRSEHPSLTSGHPVCWEHCVTWKMFDRKSHIGDISNTKPSAIRFHADFQLYKPLFETGSQLSESHWFTDSPVRRVKDKNHEQALTPSLSQPVQFLGRKIHGCACKQYIFWFYFHIYIQCYAFWWKSFHMPAQKRKQKAKNKNFKFRILIGHFQATSWQWKGWIYNNSTCWSTHAAGHNHFNLASDQNASIGPRGHTCSQANLDIFLLAHMKKIIADTVGLFCSLVQ